MAAVQHSLEGGSLIHDPPPSVARTNGNVSSTLNSTPRDPKASGSQASTSQVLTADAPNAVQTMTALADLTQYWADFAAGMAKQMTSADLGNASDPGPQSVKPLFDHLAASNLGVRDQRDRPARTLFQGPVDPSDPATREMLKRDVIKDLTRSYSDEHLADHRSILDALPSIYAELSDREKSEYEKSLGKFCTMMDRMRGKPISVSPDLSQINDKLQMLTACLAVITMATEATGVRVSDIHGQMTSDLELDEENEMLTDRIERMEAYYSGLTVGHQQAMRNRVREPQSGA